MIRISATLFAPIALTLGLFQSSLLADAGHKQTAVHHGGPSGPATVKVELLPSESALVAGQESPAVIRLTDPKGKPVSFKGLKTAHTKKIHLLIIDESLTDYHHEHPVPTAKPGEYKFTFQPKTGGRYTIFADLVPTATGKQEYARTDVEVQGEKKPLDESAGQLAEVDGYKFELSAEGESTLRVGEAKLVKVKVTKPDGQAAGNLEPVMGAFAHGVGFPSDRSGVVHVHPMGKEPTKASERGGPELTFHIVPEHAGYMKFYVQVQIGGEDKFAGFGFKVSEAQPVAPASATTAASTLTAPQKQFMEHYEMVRSSLAADDLPKAKKAAEILTGAKDVPAPAAAKIAKSKTIKAAREAFIGLSMQAMKLAANQPGYFVMACPMVERGDWVQTKAQVENPYMGSAMLQCGSVKK